MSQISEEQEQQSGGGFTPGPWEVFTDGDGVAHVCAVDRGYITTPEHERDARVIAATPEMFEALRQIVRGDWLRQQRFAEDTDADFLLRVIAEMRKVSRAALAKTGAS